MRPRASGCIKDVLQIAICCPLIDGGSNVAAGLRRSGAAASINRSRAQRLGSVRVSWSRHVCVRSKHAISSGSSASSNDLDRSQRGLGDLGNSDLRVPAFPEGSGGAVAVFR